MKNIIFLLFLLINSYSFSQQTDFVDFKTVDAEISIFPHQKQLKGEVDYQFELLQPTDSIYIDAKKMQFSNIRLNGKKVRTKATADKLWIFLKNKKPGDYNLKLDYTAKPSQTMYFIDWGNKHKTNPQVWTQGQGKYTSHWLPSFDDYNEKAVFDFTINFPEDYFVMANGVLQNQKKLNDSTVQWKYNMQHPMSSYLAAIAAGNFESENLISNSGVRLRNFYEPQHIDKVEPTYRHTKEIFDFFEKEIGIAYPWRVYKQVPVRDFLYAGMENTSLTIFSDLFMLDSTAFIDRNYVNVNAHELAHQWFGDMITAASDSHHWLQEGFATYYALLAEREVFGDDYYYWKLFEIANQLKKRSDAGKAEAILDDSSNSLTYYQKGALALHILKERIGAEAFKEAVKNYLEKYKFQNVKTEDFIAEAEKASGINLQNYVNEWLKSSEFKETETFESLSKSDFIRKYLAVAALRNLPFDAKAEKLEAALDFPVNDFIGQEVVMQIKGDTSARAIDLYEKAFETNNVLVRQAIAHFVTEIPQELQTHYESLLQDKSYATQEAALYNLWNNFKDRRATYLDEMSKATGFNDKNLRMMWLMLHLVTPEYEPERKNEIFSELSSYTANHYPYQVRRNAFNYLYQLDSFQKENLKDLVEASTHHVWRFREFSRELLQQLLAQEAYREKFVALSDELPENQQDFLESKIE